ncbi:hypothetical protein PsorP6_002536 [Peronosclerospora sorghi]|uniref:Uncharacterized protein n=1 Tax=Peronosclerospora sorghi TaxID=230839 RepID=A0ACC0WUJ5_9STRA|nr:hypothetical protein PsorP6_002536 [Peronosclerospora sorghi]
MERGSHQPKRSENHFGDEPSPRKAKIKNPKGDRSCYRERFYAWRKLEGRDDPTQSLRVKQMPWTSFVILENEGRMDFILGKSKRSYLNLAMLGEAVHRDCFESNQVLPGLMGLGSQIHGVHCRG